MSKGRDVTKERHPMSATIHVRYFGGPLCGTEADQWWFRARIPETLGDDGASGYYRAELMGERHWVASPLWDNNNGESNE